MNVPGDSGTVNTDGGRRKTALKMVRHREGETVLLVPEASLAEDPPPTSPVFFNPAASLNRDVAVAMAAASGASTFCDAMSGVGARGLRVAREAKGVSSVTMVDFNGLALGAARKAAALNGVRRKCRFSESETDSFLFSRFGRDQRFGCVDVDPFGTPVRHLQAAVSATSDGGVASFTATDTAVLCGVHQGTCVRRYGSLPLNNHFHNETAIRVLLGAVARAAAALDIGVQPVAAHATRHYLRVYVRVMAGASKADSALKDLGYVKWCPSCGEAAESARGETKCDSCGGKAKSAGPLWVGGLAGAAGGAKKRATEMGLARAADVFASLEGVDGFPPWSHSIEMACSALRVPSAAESDVYREIIGAGHRAMRTPFEKTGLKTDASFADVVEAVGRATAVGRLGRTKKNGA